MSTCCGSFVKVLRELSLHSLVSLNGLLCKISLLGFQSLNLMCYDFVIDLVSVYGRASLRHIRANGKINRRLRLYK